jgi:hypothetical protein
LKKATGIPDRIPGRFSADAFDPEFEQQMTMARKIMNKRRDVLQELAK